MSEETLRSQLYDSYKNRAMIYYLLYDELRAELGPKRAGEILGRAIYRRGMEKGREKYARYSPKDLPGLQKAFLGGIADDGRMFQPELIRGDIDALDIKFHACPLRDAWKEAGLPEEEVADFMPHRLADRLRHVRGRGLCLPCRHLSAQRRRLLLPPCPAGERLIDESCE